MLKLEFICESREEAQVYLNAHSYHNLISDLYAALRSAKKHGDAKDILQKVQAFMPDLAKAVDHNMGAY